MCVGPIVSAAANTGSAVTNIIGQNDARQLAKGTENQKRLAVDEQIASNDQRATADYLQSVSDENAKMTQEHQSNAEKFNDNAKQQRASDADANVAAAEGNVAGHSLDAIHSDYQQQVDFANGRMATNQQWADYQHTRNDQGYANVLVNRENSIQPYQMKVQNPVDYYGPIFGAVGNTAQAFMQGK